MEIDKRMKCPRLHVTCVDPMPVYSKIPDTQQATVLPSSDLYTSAH